MIRDYLINKYPDVTVLPIDTFPSGNINIAAEETAARVQEAGVDAVIIGNAA
jgi:predicted TIM-barrel enzyme